jgi:hypothetical protein
MIKIEEVTAAFAVLEALPVAKKHLPHYAFLDNTKRRSLPYAPFLLIQQGKSGSRKK